MIKTKTYMATDIQCEEGKHEVLFVLSTNEVDRVGDVVLPQGLVKKDYTGLPIFNAHSHVGNPQALPIGAARWVKAGKYQGKDVILSKGYFSPKDSDSSKIFNLIQDGILKGVSTGFTVHEEHPPTSAEKKLYGPTCKNVIHSWEMREYSTTPMPCLESAMAIMVSKGYPQEVLDIFKTTDVVTTAKQEEVDVATSLVTTTDVVTSVTETKALVEEVKAVQPKTKKELLDILIKHISSDSFKLNAETLLKN